MLSNACHKSTVRKKRLMDVRAIFAGLAFALIWSSAFTSARIIVADAPPMLALSLRFMISGLIGVGLARSMGQSWKLTPDQWKATIVFGICQNALYLGLNFVAMQSIEASLASIIASVMPLAVGFSGWLIFGERLSRLGILGLFVGAFGVALIMGVRLQSGADLFRNYTMHYCRYFTYHCYNDDERSVFWWEPPDDSGVADACGFRAPGGSWVFV